MSRRCASTYFDTTAAHAITDATGFLDDRAELVESFADQLAVADLTLGEFRALSAVDQLTAWRHDRLDFERAARTLAYGTRAEW